MLQREGGLLLSLLPVPSAGIGCSRPPFSAAPSRDIECHLGAGPGFLFTTQNARCFQQIWPVLRQRLCRAPLQALAVACQLPRNSLRKEGQIPAEAAPMPTSVCPKRPALWPGELAGGRSHCRQPLCLLEQPRLHMLRVKTVPLREFLREGPSGTLPPRDHGLSLLSHRGHQGRHSLLQRCC